MDAIKIAPGFEEILPQEYQDLVKDGPYGRNLSVKDLGTFKELIDDHPLCAGCTLTLSFRLVLASLPNPGDTLIVTCAGCFGVIHPQISLHCTIAPFGTHNAFASGLKRALRVKFPHKNKDVISIAGDGGFADIGLSPTLHSWFRGESFTSIMLDNECYANTGGQDSGMTPKGVVLNMSPLGKKFPKIEFAELAKVAGCAYVATVTPTKPRLLGQMVRRAVLIAREIGPTFIRIATVCQTNYKLSPIEGYNKAKSFEAEIGEYFSGEAQKFIESIEKKSPKTQLNLEGQVENED
ncbi:MAG: thiamine pyrophosphate-dependent enzyme [Bacillota bacterium]